MTTLFISDLHLADNNPVTLALFESFIATQASQAQSLYILGDLFEAWVGDDDPSDAARRVAQALSVLARQGTKIYYVHGNRDFLLGQHYADQCKMILLPDPSLIDCEGKKILISHGDLLCTDDKAYQAMRRFFHKPWVQRLFLALPRFIREKIADLMRKQSGQSHANKTPASMDAHPETVQAWFNQYQCELMVHGHTHKPFHHQVKNTHRYVLGAWDIEPKVLLVTDSLPPFLKDVFA
jgi:UDP-2,3-diacylglucosamine hydrolase